MIEIKNIKAIVTDIEGTTSSISFVKDVLFPYASEKLEAFVYENKDKDEVKKILDEVDKDIDTAISIMQTWIKEDQKIKPLKDLQGLIWEAGYKNGDFKGHIYDDAFEKLKEWHQNGLPLYIYSSGSVYAQKLLFGHTEHGDINYLFTANFDTKIGGKKEAASYQNIIAELKLKSEELLFLSDIKEELSAASEAGLQVIWLDRMNELSDDSYPKTDSFNKIAILKAEHSV